MTRARSVAMLALVIAGISWLIIWWHQHLTHGDTSLNEKDLVLGLTWMDSGKVLVLPLGLFFVAIVGLYWSMSQPGLPGRIGFAVSAGSLVAVIAGTALQFWGFEWGSYEEEFEEQAIGVGGALQAAATLVLALSLIVFGVALGRRRILSTWIAAALPISALATFYLTPTNPFPGALWLGLAGAVFWRSQTWRPDLNACPVEGAGHAGSDRAGHDAGGRERVGRHRRSSPHQRPPG